MHGNTELTVKVWWGDVLVCVGAIGQPCVPDYVGIAASHLSFQYH